MTLGVIQFLYGGSRHHNSLPFHWFSLQSMVFDFVRMHFIHDHVAREDIVINHVKTEDNLADIFTKPLNEKRLCALWCELNIPDFANMQ